MTPEEIREIVLAVQQTTKPKEKGVFVTWKHVGVLITVLGMAAGGYYNVRTAVNETKVIDARQSKYVKRFNEHKDWTETTIWELREDYWEREHKRIEEITIMKKDIEYLQKDKKP